MSNARSRSVCDEGHEDGESWQTDDDLEEETQSPGRPPGIWMDAEYLESLLKEYELERGTMHEWVSEKSRVDKKCNRLAQMMSRLCIFGYHYHKQEQAGRGPGRRRFRLKNRRRVSRFGAGGGCTGSAASSLNARRGLAIEPPFMELLFTETGRRLRAVMDDLKLSERAGYLMIMSEERLRARLRLEPWRLKCAQHILENKLVECRLCGETVLALDWAKHVRRSCKLQCFLGERGCGNKQFGRDLCVGLTRAAVDILLQIWMGEEAYAE
jgi:hypothetical protein